MKLYCFGESGNAYKCALALTMADLDWEPVFVDFFKGAARSPEFRKINEMGEVPVLVEGEARIFESTVILEYVEERWPEPPLLPRDPAARAFARITEDVCDTQYEAVNWGFGEVLWFRRATGALADALGAGGRLRGGEGDEEEDGSECRGQ